MTPTLGSLRWILVVECVVVLAACEADQPGGSGTYGLDAGAVSFDAASGSPPRATDAAGAASDADAVVADGGSNDAASEASLRDGPAALADCGPPGSGQAIAIPCMIEL